MDKFVIQTSTKEEFNKVQDYYNQKFFSDYAYESYKEFSCISVKNNHLGYSPINFYQEANGKYGPIITFQEWQKLVNIKQEVNMKYVVEVNSQDEANAVYNLIEKQSRIFTTFPRVVTSNGLNGRAEQHKIDKELIQQYGPVLSFKDWALIFGVELKPNKTLKLTSDYDATVNYSEEIVQVGCQSIPFAKVKELYKLIKQ